MARVPADRWPDDAGLAALVASGDLEAAAVIAAALDHYTLAHALAALQARDAARLVTVVDDAVAAQAVWELERADRLEVLAELETEQIVRLVERLPDDGATDLLEELDSGRRQTVLGELPAENRVGVERLLAHAEETAGAIMSTAFVSVPMDATIEDVLRALRTRPDTPFVYYVYLVGPRGEVAGVVSLREVLVAQESTRALGVATRDVLTVPADADQEDVARLADRYDLLAVPVTAPDGRMLGIVTADDVLEVMTDEAEEDIERFAGGEEADRARPGVLQVARTRVPWVTGTVVLEVGLAYLLLRPLPAGPSRFLLAFLPLLLFAGSSTAIAAAGVMLRRLVRQHRTTPRLLARELQGALLLGLVGATMVAASLFLAGQPSRVAGVVGWSTGLTIVAASTIGAVAPLVLHAIRSDPVRASGPALTLLADAVALAIYLGAAHLEFG